jgi:hypothetical protein
MTLIQGYEARGQSLVLPVTIDAPKWRQHSQDLDEPLHIIEIADPDEPAG